MRISRAALCLIALTEVEHISESTEVGQLPDSEARPGETVAGKKARPGRSIQVEGHVKPLGETSIYGLRRQRHRL